MRQFFIRLLLQTEGFLQHGKGENEAAQAELLSESQDILVGHEASVATQLHALRRIWGERLVIIYNVHVPNFGRDIPGDYEDDTVIQAAREAGIPLINLYRPMLAAFREGRPPRGFQNSVLGVGHFNQTGHQIIAGELLHFLAQDEQLELLP
jgi:hypothetical protein